MEEKRLNQGPAGTSGSVSSQDAKDSIASVSNATLVDTQQEVFEERSWDVPALNLWHYEPE